MIEESQGKLQPKHRRNSPVQIRLRQRSFVQAVQQRFLEDVVVEVVELHIDA